MRATAASIGGAVLAVLVAVGDARSVTVGTGSFDIAIEIGGLPSPLTGQIAFASADADLFGTPVNLGVVVGGASITNPPSGILTYVGPVASGDYGTFVSRATSLIPGVLAMDTLGEFVCAPAGCASGSPGVFVGTGVSLSGTLPATWPSGLVYTTEGSSSCCEGAVCVPPEPAWRRRCSGVFTLNAFQPQNTPVDNSPDPLPLSATFYNTLSNQLETVTVEVAFSRVTSSGTTTLTGSSAAGGAVDPRFEIAIGGFQAIFFDVSTTAVYEGKITVCGHYADADADGVVDGTSVPERDLVLLHREGNEFVPVQANHVDAATNRVCGSVSSLSPFAIAVSPVGNVPPSQDELACESRLAVASARLVRDAVKCEVKAVRAAYAGKSLDLGACEESARRRYDRAASALVAGGCPACLASNAPGLGDLLQAVVRIEVGPKTFCAGAARVGF